MLPNTLSLDSLMRYVSGYFDTPIPEASLLFSTFSLHTSLLKAIERLGFQQPTPVQEKTIPLALQGKDLLVSAETGSGKTAAFLLPTIQRMLDVDAPDTGTRVLILLPTRELALQTLSTCEKLMRFTPIKAGIIVGGEAFKHQVAMLRKNPEIIIATPGRLVEHIERGTPDFNDLEILILDEADRMLDMGFAEDMLEISRVCKDERQNLLFSATLRHQGIRTIASTLLNEPESVSVNNIREAHSSIVQQMILADDVKHKEKLVAALVSEEEAEKTIVFCNTRAQCSQLGNLLDYKKFKVGILHGEIAQSDRKQIMNRFRQGHIKVLVTTDVAARGLDVRGINLVINFEVPRSGDDYLHRSGRTGRAGESGRAIMLVSSLEWAGMSSIERYLKLRFEQRKLDGLVATYKGPKKVKSSGKAAGKKKVKDSGKKSTAIKKGKETKATGGKVKKTTKKSHVESTATNDKPLSKSDTNVAKKTVNKPSKPKSGLKRGPVSSSDRDGFSPLKRKK